MSVTPEFNYDENDDSYKYGTKNHGIGIYKEGHEHWEGNIVIHGNLTIGYGPYSSLLEAKEELIKEFNKQNII